STAAATIATAGSNGAIAAARSGRAGGSSRLPGAKLLAEILNAAFQHDARGVEIVERQGHLHGADRDVERRLALQRFQQLAFAEIDVRALRRDRARRHLARR